MRRHHGGGREYAEQQELIAANTRKGCCEWIGSAQKILQAISNAFELWCEDQAEKLEHSDGFQVERARAERVIRNALTELQRYIDGPERTQARDRAGR